MGLFSIYTGLIYNDMFSLPVNLFSSAWSHDAATGNVVQNGVCLLGIDTEWHHSDNGLIFTNSYKMKMSIILGVTQMTFGILLNYWNFVEFDQLYSIYLELVPQLLFMVGIFGYLCGMIVLKWFVDWFAFPPNESSSWSNPPSLLNMLVSMFLQPGTVKPTDQMYPGQVS